MIRRAWMLLIVACCALGLSTTALAEPDEGVNRQDLFGVDSTTGADPADPPPVDVDGDPGEAPPPGRRGLDPTGKASGMQVRTGLSPLEVKREPTPAELAAEAAEAQAIQQQADQAAFQNGMILFVGVVLFVLVLGGMAYAVFAMVFQKRPAKEGDGKDQDEFAHLVQHDAPVPAPTPPPTPAPVPAATNPAASEFLTGQPTPAPAARRQEASFTPASVPSRHPDTPASVQPRYSPPDPGSMTPPIIAATATPAPMLAHSKPQAPTPAGYVPPRRPQPTTPRDPSPAASSVSGEVDGTFVSYGNPVPLFRTERSETPAPTAARTSGFQKGLPAASDLDATPVPAFTQDMDDETPAPAHSTPSYVSESLPTSTPLAGSLMTPIPIETRTPYTPPPMPTPTRGTPSSSASRPSMHDASPVPPMAAHYDDEDEDVSEDATVIDPDIAGMATPSPVRRHASATPPPMPWKRRG